MREQGARSLRIETYFDESTMRILSLVGRLCKMAKLSIRFLDDPGCVALECSY